MQVAPIALPLNLQGAVDASAGTRSAVSQTRPLFLALPGITNEALGFEPNRGS